ncbi:MYG1 family protein [Garciella nitratireducens]|uniref:Uncharacterized protein, UPF0160 family n=1 Tax=Garciella nitratireducens DSM 15102 TaxID=1121911 RepID=A0A1T4MZL0_9FIRM|nr:MYG1 family protein [Garciella nitratireducens]SJZ72540.1 Uncharacterized protein, UPF0160 family [Garciella nitratireducens DSM 15102]
MFCFYDCKTKKNKERIKIDRKKTFKEVGTHDGRFHADEVMATAILSKIFDIKVVRTRDKKILDQLDIVYDVGGGKFDHHGAEKVYRDNGIPFAACGLIWNEFGGEVIKKENPDLTEAEIDSIFKYVDTVLVEGIDANDNGIKPEDREIIYMNISTVLSGFNPPWYLEDKEEELFFQAVEVSKQILKNTIQRKLEVIKAKDHVISAYKNRDRMKILVLDQYCPWQETLQEIDKEENVLFTVYPNQENFAIQTVKDQEGGTRKYLPKEWAGKENQDLVKVTGVEDAVFCHTGRFLAIAASLEGIMKMAEIAIHSSDRE